VDPALAKCVTAIRLACEQSPPSARIEVIVRVEGSARQLRSALEVAGLEVHSVIGPVATGIIAADAVPRLAGLDDVVRVELARPLYPES
jgi:hypothetical protein